MFHYFVTMKVLSRFLTILCNTLELSILKFVIISLRDHVAKGDIKLKHVRTDKQLADIFTKPLDEKVFCRLRGESNIIDASNLE